MATYLPNVKDYVPQVKAYTPDFKFLSDSLDQRQDRYNKSTEQLNNLYGQVVYADLSRDDNQSIRDDYAKTLAPKIQQISGLDFSLQQNVQAAQGLFKPFYEDDKVVRDIVFTKAYKDQMQLANSFKGAASAEERDRYWEDGVEYMNFMLDDFKNKSRDESMTVQLPQYVEDPDLFSRGLNALETGGPDGKGIKTTEMYVDQSGQFIVTMENGTQLTNKPTGRMIPNREFDETKKESSSNPKEVAEMYNPAANRIKETVLDDPIVQQGLRVQAYVAGRKTYEQQVKESGQPEDVYKREWANKQLELYSNESSEVLKVEREQLNIVNQELVSWEVYQKQAPLIAGSDEYQAWFEAMTKGETISKGINKTEVRQKDILQGVEEEDIDNLMNRAYAAYISNQVSTGIFDAARQYRDETSKRTFTESKIAIEKLRHRNNLERDRLKREADLKAKILADLQSIDDVSSPPVVIPGNALENIMKTGTQIEKNESGELKVYKDQKTDKIKGIVAFYSYMADEINTDASIANMADLRLTDGNLNQGEVSTAGIYLPNRDANTLQFYRWEDAYQILLDNPEVLDYHYTRMSNIHNNPDLAASYKSSNKMQLRSIIGGVIEGVNMTNTKLDIIKGKQNEVYQNIIADLDIENIRAGLGQENVADWDINMFDEDGHMKTTERMYSDKIEEVQSTLREFIPKSLPSTQQITDQFYVNNNWVTSEQDPNSPVSTEDLMRYSRDGIQGIFAGYYHGFVKSGAEKLGMEPSRFFTSYYQPSRDPNAPITLTPKPGSKNDVYTDIAEDYLSFGSYRAVIDEFKGAMDKVMDSDLAVNNETTFDFDSHYYGNGTVGDMEISRVIPYRFDAGTKDKYVNGALDHFFGSYDILKSMPGGVVSSLGDNGDAFELLGLDDQQISRMVLEQIRADRNYRSGSTSKSTDPGYRLEYSEVGGGEDGEGNYAMYKFILDGDYATQIEKTMPTQTGVKFKIPNNTVTIFANKDLFSNPLDSDQQYSSAVKTMIRNPDNQGRATLSLDGGGIIHFEMNNGVITERSAEYVYNTSGPNKGNMTLGNVTIRPLVDGNGHPLTDANVDLYYEDQRKALEDIANTNLQAQENFKLTQAPVTTEQ
jgi:hypothetical protein